MTGMDAHGGEWSDVVVAAGLDPREVKITIVKRWFRRAPTVRASHAARGLVCEAGSYGTTHDNAVAAIAGLADLLSGGAT